MTAVNRATAPSQRGALLTVHLAVLLFGLAGVLGKLTALPATTIVLGRVVRLSSYLLRHNLALGSGSV